MDLNELRRLAGLKEDLKVSPPDKEPATQPQDKLTQIAESIYFLAEGRAADEAAEGNVALSGDMIEEEAKKVLHEVARQVLTLVVQHQSGERF